jgi:hypothetical protein
MAPAKRSSKKKKQQRQKQVVPREGFNYREQLEAATTGRLGAVKEYLYFSWGCASALVYVPIDGKLLTVPLLQAVVANPQRSGAERSSPCETGANVNATFTYHDGQQCSALMWAVAGASCRTVEALLRAGADPCQRLNDDGMTPLSRCVSWRLS